MSNEPVAVPLATEVSHLRLLADAARFVHASLDVREKLGWCTRAALELSGAGFAAYVSGAESGSRVEAVAGIPPRPAAATALRGQPAPAWAVGEAIDPAFVGSGTSRRGAVAPPGIASWIAVPVLAGDGRQHGTLVAGHRDPGVLREQADVGVRAVASHLGVALDNRATVTRLAELEAVQREVVHQLQEAVRTPMPAVESAELGVHYLPADPSAPTGGDLYDWLVLPDGDLHLAVVDIMGKGVAATKDALSVTHALRLLVLDGCPLDRLVGRADLLVTAQNPDLVATLMIARYRPSDGVVQLVGAGHPPALVASHEGNVRYVSAPGIPIGWLGAGSSEVVTVTLDRADTLVLYTDGLIEATKDILSGLDGLADAAAQTARYPARQMARVLVERALSGAMRRDDSLALVLRRRTPPPLAAVHPLAPLEYRFSPNTASVPLARHFLSDWLEHLGIDASDAADLLLVASELAANAVQHASGAPGNLALRAWADGSDVVLEVEDDGGGFDIPDRYDEEVPEPTDEQGRGLFLVEALSDDIDVRRVEGCTIVRVVKRAILSAREAPPEN